MSNRRYRTHLRSIVVAVSLMPDGFQLFCPARHMISHLVAIELCETACLSALFFKKRSQMGSIGGGMSNLWFFLFLQDYDRICL